MFWTAQNLRSLTGGSWLRRPGPQVDDQLDGIGTDSRALRRGQAFLAIPGERFDGHDFLMGALDAGSPLLVVQDQAPIESLGDRVPQGVGVLRVKDSVRALGLIAQGYRRSLVGVRVIAVCGSNGKTTTCRLITGALSKKLRGSSSPKSFNNEIGLPLTILGAKPTDQFLVCEVGTNAPGEIAYLGSIVQPDVAVITSIGRAHMENFESVDDVAREDAAIFADLRANGLAVAPVGNKVLDDHLRVVPNVVTFGRGDDADLRISDIEHVALGELGQGLRFTVNGRSEFQIPLVGAHNAQNAVAAIAVARRLGLDDRAIAAGLSAVQPADLRLNQREIGGIRVIADCYNANPESMIAALETFEELGRDSRRRVLVVGDMLELGESAEHEHEAIGRFIAERCHPGLVFTVGRHALHTAEAISRAECACELRMLSSMDESAAAKIASRLEPGDTLLLKGSRGIRLEMVLSALERRAGIESGVA